MTPSQLKQEIISLSTELAAEIHTQEKHKNRQHTEAEIYNALVKISTHSMSMLVDVYGEYTKRSPAYDRMKAAIVETQA